MRLTPDTHVIAGVGDSVASRRAAVVSVPTATDLRRELKRAAESVDLQPSPDQIDCLIRHAELVAESAGTANLTALRSVEGIVRELVIPGIGLLAPAGGWLPTAEWWAGRKVIDVGTGAGFPGIPLAALLPECEFTLLDARSRKCRFLGAAVSQLGLPNVAVVNSRAEDAGRNPGYRERFDVATARAVARLPELAELVLPFVEIGGVAVLPKGGSEADITREVGEASGAVSKLGSAPPVVMPFSGSGHGDSEQGAGDSRDWMVYLMKIESTPARYPRNPGIPRKRPLQ